MATPPAPRASHVAAVRIPNPRDSGGRIEGRRHLGRNAVTPGDGVIDQLTRLGARDLKTLERGMGHLLLPLVAAVFPAKGIVITGQSPSESRSSARCSRREEIHDGGLTMERLGLLDDPA
jgi:hypothetical protein